MVLHKYKCQNKWQTYDSRTKPAMGLSGGVREDGGWESSKGKGLSGKNESNIDGYFIAEGRTLAKSTCLHQQHLRRARGTSSRSMIWPMSASKRLLFVRKGIVSSPSGVSWERK